MAPNRFGEVQKYTMELFTIFSAVRIEFPFNHFILNSLTYLTSSPPRAVETLPDFIFLQQLK